MVGGSEGSLLFKAYQSAVITTSSANFLLSYGISFVFSLLLVVWEGHYDRSGRSGRKGIRYIETATAAAMALRAACSGIEIQDHTHRRQKLYS